MCVFLAGAGETGARLVACKEELVMSDRPDRPASPALLSPYYHHHQGVCV